MAQQKVIPTRSGNIIRQSVLNDFMNSFPNTLVHFINFQFYVTSKKFKLPVEIAISTYDLIKNKEFNWFQAFIGNNADKSDIETMYQIYGNDPRNSNITFEKVNDVRSKLQTYFNYFEGTKWICIKDDIGNNDYNYLKQIIGSVPFDICFITRNELFYVVCQYYNISLQRKNISKLNSIYKPLKTCQRCNFHETTEKRFSCSLRDSRSFAVTTIVEMNNLGIPIENSKELPSVEIIPTTFGINTNNFLFVNVDKYNNSSQISEILLTQVTFTNHQIQTCESPIFQYLLLEKGTKNQEQSIVQEFFTQNNLTTNQIIYEHIQKVIDKGDDKQVIVLCDKLKAKNIPQISFDDYLCITQAIFLQQFIKEISNTCSPKFTSLMNFTTKLYPNPLILKHCGLLHKESFQKCSLWQFNHFIYILDQFRTNFSSIINDFNASKDEKQKLDEEQQFNSLEIH